MSHNHGGMMNATMMPMHTPMTNSHSNSSTSGNGTVDICQMMMHCPGMNGGHGTHGGGTTMMHMMMPMFFETGKDLTILFEGWKTDTVGELFGSLIALFVMAFLYEGIKIFREELKKREFKNVSGNGTYDLKEKSGACGNGDTRTHQPKFIVNKAKILSTLHFFQTFLHMVQVFVGYLLMLAVMTFNTWIFLAVILGSGAGYFAFGWKRASIVDVGDHCL